MQSEIEYIRMRALEVYTPEGVNLWMDARNRLLDGCTPMELIAQGRGDEVLNLIAALGEGTLD